MLTDYWFLLGLACMAVATVLTGIGCVGVHCLNERLEHRTPETQRRFDDLSAQWQVFLLNVRIAAYSGKDKSGAAIRPPRSTATVLPFPRLPSY